MKNFRNNHTLATVALLTAGVAGGIMPILSKLLFRELSPLSVLFFSITIMLGVLIPLNKSFLGDIQKQWLRLVLFGLLWTGNVMLFILGVNHTTAIVSQILYAGVPLIVLFEQYVVHGERISFRQVIGILIGFTGVMILAVGSIRGSADLGSLNGNFLVFLATLSWASYLVFSKRLSVHLRSMVLTTASAIVAWCTSLGVLLLLEGWRPFVSLLTLSATGWALLLLIGLVVRVGMILFYNWGIKYGSSIVAGSMVFVSTMTSVVIAPLILGEALTVRLVAAAALLFFGVFLAKG